MGDHILLIILPNYVMGKISPECDNGNIIVIYVEVMEICMIYTYIILYRNSG